MADDLDQMLSTFETCWAIVRRRRWWILIPAVVTWAGVWGISWLLPSTYQSEALILLEQQNVPNQYVVPNVSASIQDRLQTISQQVLSRTRLQATIDRFHLYPEPHGSRFLLEALVESGDPVDKMRKDIDIELVAVPGHPDSFTAFKMRYTAKSPQLAQQVNNELTSPFVNENVEAEQQASEETTSFLENQLADARNKMEELETKVASFKAKHPGASPSQVEMNVQQLLTGLQTQLQSSHQALESAKQQKLSLELMIRQNQSAQANASSAANGNGAAADPSTTLAKELDKELTDLRLRLQDMRQQYTDDYPEVVALKDKIAQREKLKKLADDQVAANLSTRKTATAGDANAMERTQSGSSPALVQLENQLKANQQEIQEYQKRESELESQASTYLARLNVAPETEQELARIARDYEESKANYNSLLQKQMQSQLATRLEQRQKGEQFRVLDPPSLPKKHVSPNRFKFSLEGSLLGIALGLGIAAILELTDIRVRNEKELKELVPIPMLVSIPRLSTQREKDAHVLALWVDSSALTIVLLLIMAGNCYAYFKR